MTNHTELNETLNSFKSQMRGVNESLHNFDSSFNKIKLEVEELRLSFSYVVKVINHELIECLDDAREIMNKFPKK